MKEFFVTQEAMHLDLVHGAWGRNFLENFSFRAPPARNLAYGYHGITPPSAESCGPTLTLGGLLPASVICGPCDHGASWVVQKSTFAN